MLRLKNRLSFLHRLTGDKEARARAKRQHARVPCLHIAQLRLHERGITFEGCINEISRKGVRFRPASKYLLQRSGERVAIILNDAEYHGLIRNTQSMGYGVALDLELPEEVFADLCAMPASPEAEAA